MIVGTVRTARARSKSTVLNRYLMHQVVVYGFLANQSTATFAWVHQALLEMVL